MLVANSCLLTDVTDQLPENSKKINVVDPLSKHLYRGVPGLTAASYLQTVKKWVPDEPVIHIDDSDVDYDQPGVYEITYSFNYYGDNGFAKCIVVVE